VLALKAARELAFEANFLARAVFIFNTSVRRNAESDRSRQQKNNMRPVARSRDTP
jgi:hypothetical protein